MDVASVVISLSVSFLVAYLFMPLFMVFARKIGLTGIDQQKKGKPSLPTSGGVPAFVGLLMGLLTYLFMISFFEQGSAMENLTAKVNILAAILSIGMITVVGFFDDIFMKQEAVKSRSDTVEKRHGLKQWMKPLLTLFGAIPLMVVMLGTTSMAWPFLGEINFGIFFPLILVPAAVVTVSNATNMLAGVNGLEAGLMAVASFFLGLFCLSYGTFEGAMIAFALFAALMAFLLFNWFPSKILPGDSLTYFLGGAFVAAVVIGNVEKFAIIIFIPWIVEAFLELTAKFKARSFGDLQEDGTIKAPYPDRIYSLTHVVMKLPEWLGRKRFKENQIALILIGFEFLLCLSVYSFYSIL
jgi:UDP-N-acetylglucosamine--dolichyl-phosphate N-acetylglucosaminephosphotransferase